MPQCCQQLYKTSLNLQVRRQLCSGLYRGCEYAQLRIAGSNVNLVGNHSNASRVDWGSGCCNNSPTVTAVGSSVSCCSPSSSCINLLCQSEFVLVEDGVHLHRCPHPVDRVLCTQYCAGCRPKVELKVGEGIVGFKRSSKKQGSPSKGCVGNLSSDCNGCNDCSDCTSRNLPSERSVCVKSLVNNQEKR